MIYFDHNATTPVSEEVLAKMIPWFSTKFGNAASKTHAFGWEAAEAVKLARAQVATMLNVSEAEIVFNSGATEGINQTFFSIYKQYAAKGDHIVVAQTEHSAVLDTCAALEKMGARITYLPVNENGEISIAALENAIAADTILVAIIFANNESGIVQPIKQIGEICRTKKVLFFSDITQACGKISLDLNELNIDIAAFSAHKFGGPKGVGGLFMRRRSPRVSLLPLIYGGGHENGYRSGTLNVPGIVGMGEAAKLASQNISVFQEHCKALQDFFESEIVKLGAQIVAQKAERISNTTYFRIPNLKASDIIKATPHFAVSTGSACGSEINKPSHVLKAMAYSDLASYECIRVSFGLSNTLLEVEKYITVLRKLI